ncbi:MAG: TolC family protein [Ignavibacteria bacterium]|nr:TolC family protein [Ignavibacteria bacterium]MBT8382102.1 TolC family protein [Ignavibacteria bacterium]MBT8392014.1 TolC family protein [Ignavibacteria bacterium]NNJ51819.1 TolC family protein [Ignavibacteriaceae bacterium]NNL21888.1 TolC family protein [Ignavibacteriaceae bacterium]
MKNILLFFITIVQFTPAQDVITLNLEKSIQIALENNQDLMIAELEKEISDEQVTEAFGSSVLPDIKGSVNYQRAIKRGEFIIETPFFSGSFPQGTENTMSFGVTLDQPLFTGAVFFATRIANVFAEISQTAYYATKASLIKNVKSAYYSYILAEKFLELSNITLEAAEDNLNDVEVRYKVGVAPEYDLIRARVQVQNILPEVQKAENSIKLAENSLKIVLGLQIEQTISIEDSLEFEEIEVEEYSFLASLLEDKNFSLQQLRLQIELQDKAASYEFSRHFPELYFFGNWATIAQENDPRSFWDWRYKNSVYVGLNLKVPIFNGWQTTSRVNMAEIELEKVKEQYDLTNNSLKNQLENILLGIKETRFQIDAYSSTIEQAQIGYDISLKRYNSGVGTQLETIDSLVELTRARVNFLNAIYDYYVLHASLEELLSTEVQVQVD